MDPFARLDPRRGQTFRLALEGEEKMRLFMAEGAASIMAKIAAGGPEMLPKIFNTPQIGSKRWPLAQAALRGIIGSSPEQATGRKTDPTRQNEHSIAGRMLRHAQAATASREHEH
jgi:hypothetical protein